MATERGRSTARRGGESLARAGRAARVLGFILSVLFFAPGHAWAVDILIVPFEEPMPNQAWAGFTGAVDALLPLKMTRADHQVVDRTNLGAARQELALSGLSGAGHLHLGRMANADVLVMGRFYLADPQTLAVSAWATSLHTLEILASVHLRASGPQQDPDRFAADVAEKLFAWDRPRLEAGKANRSAYSMELIQTLYAGLMECGVGRPEYAVPLMVQAWNLDQKMKQPWPWLAAAFRSLGYEEHAAAVESKFPLSASKPAAVGTVAVMGAEGLAEWSHLAEQFLIGQGRVTPLAWFTLAQSANEVDRALGGDFMKTARYPADVLADALLTIREADPGRLRLTLLRVENAQILHQVDVAADQASVSGGLAQLLGEPPATDFRWSPAAAAWTSADERRARSYAVASHHALAKALRDLRGEGTSLDAHAILWNYFSDPLDFLRPLQERRIWDSVPETGPDVDAKAYQAFKITRKTHPKSLALLRGNSLESAVMIWINADGMVRRSLRREDVDLRETERELGRALDIFAANGLEHTGWNAYGTWMLAVAALRRDDRDTARGHVDALRRILADAENKPNPRGMKLGWRPTGLPRIERKNTGGPEPKVGLRGEQSDLPFDFRQAVEFLEREIAGGPRSAADLYADAFFRLRGLQENVSIQVHPAPRFVGGDETLIRQTLLEGVGHGIDYFAQNPPPNGEKRTSIGAIPPTGLKGTEMKDILVFYLEHYPPILEGIDAGKILELHEHAMERYMTGKDMGPGPHVADSFGSGGSVGDVDPLGVADPVARFKACQRRLESQAVRDEWVRLLENHGEAIKKRNPALAGGVFIIARYWHRQGVDRANTRKAYAWYRNNVEPVARNLFADRRESALYYLAAMLAEDREYEAASEILKAAVTLPENMRLAEVPPFQEENLRVAEVSQRLLVRIRHAVEEGQAPPAILFGQARAAHRRGDADAAAALYQKVLDSSWPPGDADARRYELSARYHLAWIRFEEGDAGECTRLCKANLSMLTGKNDGTLLVEDVAGRVHGVPFAYQLTHGLMVRRKGDLGLRPPQFRLAIDQDPLPHPGQRP